MGFDVSLSIAILYFAVMAAFAVFGYIVFYRGKHVDLKRKWWPRYVFVLAAFVACDMVFSILQTPSPKPEQDQHLELPLIIMLGIISGTTFILIKKTKFCGKCAAIVQAKLFDTIKFCPKCGGELTND